MGSSAAQLVRTTFLFLAFLLIAICATYPVSASASFVPKGISFLRWLGDSTLIAAAVALPGVALASASGYGWSRARFLRRGSRLGVALLAQLLPAAILLGLICAALVWRGLLAPWPVLFVIYFVTALPFCIWQMKRNYDSIPISLEEAAEIEGASVAKIFFSIVFPLVSPALAITFLFSFLAAWNEYLLGGMVPRGREVFSPPAPLDFAPQTMAVPIMSLLVAVPAVVVFLIVSRLLVSVTNSRAIEEQ
jgi:arabinogalactan oligomer/maltooligosaccharide transport system permease protein